MAIVQISRIQHRRGLKEQLPQLSAGELGYAVDTQELFIGNGTLADGAPEVGNTKIITEDDNLLSTANTYTFRGNTTAPALTGVDSNSPIVRTLQQKLDDFANVKDFGAVGDGTTDDTAAINRAMANLITLETTGKEKRQLYFPGGKYKVTSTIKIYPHITLSGDGHTSTILESQNASTDYVFEFVDSNGNSRSDIGSGGAERPQGISISGMSFKTLYDQNIMRIDQATSIRFHDVHFLGIYAQEDGATNGNAGVEIFSSSALQTKRIDFINCIFEGSENLIKASEDIQDISVYGSEFLNANIGVNLANETDGSTSNKITGPQGVAITASRFDNIDAQAVIVYDNGGSPHGNIVSSCSFRDVGSGGIDSSVTEAISFLHANNFAFGNYFHRLPYYERSYFAGSVYSESPVDHPITLNDNASGATMTDNVRSESVRHDLQRENHVVYDYIIIRGTARRTGKLTISGTASSFAFSDEFTENAATGVTITVDSNGVLKYSTTSTGTAGTFKYRILRFL